MVNRVGYFASFALALLLAGDVLVEADVYVCGVDYDDAALNCVINTACPRGEGCLSEQTCFAIPEDKCVGTTATASPSPTSTPPDLFVCGITLGDALSRCRSAEDACAGVTGTTAYCAVADAGSPDRSCFVIPREACFARAPSGSPASATGSTTPAPATATTTAAAVAPGASSPLGGSTAAPAAPADPPAPGGLFVCGVDYSDASDNYCALAACPNGGVSCPPAARSRPSERSAPPHRPVFVSATAQSIAFLPTNRDATRAWRASRCRTPIARRRRRPSPWGPRFRCAVRITTTRR
jgi:hypothetical protein